MTAKEAISHKGIRAGETALQSVGGDMPVLEVLPLLLDSPQRQLSVIDRGEMLGVIDGDSLLEALGRMIAVRDDSSIVEISCAPGDFSASHIARAVEDADVHLVDMLTAPASEGRLAVTLRVRCTDPTSVIHCLERYGYEVTGSHGSNNMAQSAAVERLLGLQALINV